MNGQVESQMPSRSVQNVKARTGTKREKLTQERLKELLHYNPDTGAFTWRVRRRRIPAGSPAGCISGTGYVTMRVDGYQYLAHRLAWLYMEGYLPENTVDHENCVYGDNRWINLREATNQCQMRNRGVFTCNTSTIKGVWWSERKKRWRVQIGIAHMPHHVGYYIDILDAAYHRYAAEQCLGFLDCDTNSSAKKFIDSQMEG